MDQIRRAISHAALWTGTRSGTRVPSLRTDTRGHWRRAISCADPVAKTEDVPLDYVERAACTVLLGEAIERRIEGNGDVGYLVPENGGNVGEGDRGSAS